MEYGLIGEKLGHSYSPQIHAALAGYDYVLCPVARENLHTFMMEKAFKGINVTIPYKKDVLPYLNELTDDAKEIQCVNTIIKRPDGTLLGHNTDISGFMTMVKNAQMDVQGKKVVVLGSGGTSLTATVSLRKMGAKEIVIISRTGENDYQSLYEKHKDAQVLVNTTPVGMYPNNGQSPADLSRLPKLECVIDVIYNPEKTALILQAESLHIPCVSGLPMLVAQARKAAEMFSGKAIPESEDSRIIKEIKSQTLNLILIGMPGCGKSNIGRRLAERMNRPLIDTDAEIEKLAGKSIPEIFANDGETHFRNLEAEVLSAFCKGHGQVITTGGGAILRAENRQMMHGNGRVCLIERPLHLLARDGRPLSLGDGAIEKLWQQRKDIYQATCDYTITNNADMDAAVSAAWEGFYETVGD